MGELLWTLDGGPSVICDTAAGKQAVRCSAPFPG